MQVAYDYRRLAHRSAKCKSLSASWRTSPRNARGFPPFGETFREMQEPFCRLANISCNLRETFVPLQTSPAICGRLSYPYKHLLQSAGDLRTPTNISCNLRETFVPLRTISCNLRETFVPLRKSASAFFSLMICASYRKPYFCFIKIQYPEEIIRKYTQLSR